MYFWVSQGIAGFGLAIVVFMNHYPIEKVDRERLAEGDWAALQCAGTLNVTQGWFPRLNDWLFGGLNFQIEHHLFPTMPRHNLRSVSPKVRAFCHTFGLPYTDVSPFGGVQMILGWLKSIAGEIKSSSEKRH